MVQRASPPTFGRLGLVCSSHCDKLVAGIFLHINYKRELSKVVYSSFRGIVQATKKDNLFFFLLGLFLKTSLYSSKEQTVFVKNLIFFMRNMKYQTLSSHVMYFTTERVKIGPLPWQ